VLTVDTAGMISSNSYDAALRPLASTLLGNPASPFGPAQADLTTSVILDAAGNPLQTTTAGQSASGANLAFVSSNAYGVRGVRCAHGGQPPGYERSVSYLQNVMPGIALPQNRQKFHPDQPETELETSDFERKMAQSEFVIRLGRGLELNLDLRGES